MANVITKINANSYNGQFSYNGCTGSFNTDGQKHINSISGIKEGVGSFDAYGSGQDWNYNPHFSDPTKAAELISLMTGAIEAVQVELSAE